MAIPAIFLGLQISGWVFAVKALQEGRVDFRAQYTAGYMLRSGSVRHLYDYGSELLVQNSIVSPRTATMPFDHLAYEALLFAPFSFLQFKAAYVAFLVLNVGVLVAAIVMIRRWTPTLNHLYSWLTPVIIIAFLPTGVALMQGQESALLLLILVVSYAALVGGNELTAGILLSLGIFKFQIILPIALMLLLWRRWSFVWAFSISSVGLVAISYALVGADAARSYVGLLTSMSVGLHTAADQARFGIPPAAMPNFRGLVTGLLGTLLPGAWEQIAIAVLSMALIFACYIRGIRSSTSTKLLIAIVVASLVSYHSLIHDMTILLLPMIIFFNDSLPAVPSGPSAQRNLAACGALLFTAPVLFCFAPSKFFIAGLASCAFCYATLRWMQASPFTAGGIQ